MKHLSTLSFLAIATIALFTPVETHAEIKIAVIDMQRTIQDYTKTKKLVSEINTQRTGYQKERDEQAQEYKQLVEEARALEEASKDPSLSEDARNEKRAELEKKALELRQRERSIREFATTTQNLLRDELQRKMKKIIEEVQAEIDAFSKGKYSLVLDKSKSPVNGTSTIVYSENMTDLTDEILKILNSKAE